MVVSSSLSLRSSAWEHKKTAAEAGMEFWKHSICKADSAV
ncbi:hypothetical protein NEIELOOT_01504 [Neisseria elongata subsp. glycolytica ATCC 29315]|uniref:Uncharacterized protein n=1 Tax=Neisseria elongata subsp. glycolytica ATCC 29315 TaxID=546263 RepID=D4DR12_NEIEG|nr:hypothetical protein NEIELOOT_01504 [Neisseria elongata subsp. glycolytica ATCC 29315]